MILVTVGMRDQPFDRLVRAADALAEGTEESVVIQRGVSRYLPRCADSFPFTTGERMISLVRRARVVISHAAAGSIILALIEDKPLILVARRQRFDESNDDHQVQIARALQQAKCAIVVQHPTARTLEVAVGRARNGFHLPVRRIALSDSLQQQLIEWDADRFPSPAGSSKES